MFEISFLSEEQRTYFHSDFRIVADYLVHSRNNPAYRPENPQKFRHADALLKLMSVLTKDQRYESIMNAERAPDNMCDVLDYVESKGRREGKAEGQAIAFVEMIETACSNPDLNWTPQTACRYLNKDYSQYLEFKKRYRL